MTRLKVALRIIANIRKTSGVLLQKKAFFHPDLSPYAHHLSINTYPLTIKMTMTNCFIQTSTGIVMLLQLLCWFNPAKATENETTAPVYMRKNTETIPLPL